MQLIKSFLINLAILILIGIVLFVIFPDMMRQVFEIYGALFGPIAIVLLFVAALPRKSSRSSQKRRSRAK